VTHLPISFHALHSLINTVHSVYSSLGTSSANRNPHGETAAATGAGRVHRISQRITSEDTEQVGEAGLSGVVEDVWNRPRLDGLRRRAVMSVVFLDAAEVKESISPSAHGSKTDSAIASHLAFALRHQNPGAQKPRNVLVVRAVHAEKERWQKGFQSRMSKTMRVGGGKSQDAFVYALFGQCCHRLSKLTRQKKFTYKSETHRY
jgi:hypothetical protein